MASNVVEAMGVADTEQTTVFVSDANVVRAEIMHPLKLSHALHTTSDIMNSQDIIAWLSKENKVDSGVFSTTDTVSTFTGLYSPSDLCTTLHLDKLKGFLGFRATVRLRIIFNATRFQQGRYMLTYVPYGGSAINTTHTDWYNAYTNTLVQRSQLNRVEFDLSCDTEAIIEIPFSSSLNFYPINSFADANNVGTWGRFRIFPYVPLTVDTGLPTASWTLYASFHDVELVGAAVPQSGRLGTTKKRNPSEQEQKSKNIGPVESAMTIGYDVSKALTAVPLLSTFALPASWIFDALKGTAAHFGWSKPANLSTIGRMTTNYAPYFGSVDNDDIGLPLSAVVSNQVDPALGFSGTDIDELDFKFFCTIPAYFGQVSWDTTDAVGSTLYTLPVYPSYYYVARPLQLPGVTDYSPVAFCAKYFRYWRGSLVYKFKFVRTEFHSGRVNIAFFPFEDNSNSAATISYAGSNYVNRHIIDIRECNEVTITVPYVSTAPFLDNLDSMSCGTLTVFVEDKLVCPSTVPQLCTIIVEVAGGPDMEFAVPINTSLCPAIRAVPQSGVMSREEPRNDCSIVTATIGGADLRANDVVNAAFCVGEKVSSWRSMLKQFSLINTTAISVSSSHKNFVPFAIPNYTADIATPVVPFTNCDLYGALSSCFLYSRGGVRLKMLVLNDTAGTQGVKMVMAYLRQQLRGTGDAVRILDAPNTTWAGTATNPSDYALGPKVLARLTDGQPMEISVPQYNRWHSRLNVDHTVSVTNPYDWGKAVNSTKFIVEVAPLGVLAFNTYRALWFRAGADDCNMGGFISIPPMVSANGFALN